jgi:hypothetical protein
MGACHRAPRFATRSRLPGPVRRPLLSRRMARQRSCSARSSRVGERCRAPPVDFCNRNDPRARPRTSELRSTAPAVARWCSYLPEVAPFRARSGLRMACLACASWPAEVPRARGRWWRGDAGSVATSPTAIARGRSFAPTRSTRAPHVVSRDERRPETTVSPETRCARLPRLTSHAALARRVRLGPCCRRRAEIGPLRVPTREGELALPHPRCLPSPDDTPRLRGAAPPSTACPQTVDGGAGASSIPDASCDS